ncbi:MAG: efflux RND transporter periplasmic adaptor subunit [Marinilabiliales bacterium]|nr:efflux RND transporter periplasmic adaptor subunit [Marinilabiliales bacterium]
MMTGTEVLRVADLNRMEVVVDVNENDIIRVKPGDTAIVEVDAYLDRDFKGVVTEIANSAKSTGDHHL